mmetsp:Transcript_144479/g.462977  ORF Transcript_144479/g.462977 Transcript_144479/m.462977 type:complete len:208 (+) Transcript_144479:164-787(+)
MCDAVVVWHTCKRKGCNRGIFLKMLMGPLPSVNWPFAAAETNAIANVLLVPSSPKSSRWDSVATATQRPRTLSNTADVATKCGEGMTALQKKCLATFTATSQALLYSSDSNALLKNSERGVTWTPYETYTAMTPANSSAAMAPSRPKGSTGSDFFFHSLYQLPNSFSMVVLKNSAILTARSMHRMASRKDTLHRDIFLTNAWLRKTT